MPPAQCPIGKERRWVSKNDRKAEGSVVESLRKPRQRPSSVHALSDREKEILKLIGQGYTSKEIGRKLFLSPKTVENYRAKILEKLQVRNCSEAVSLAITQGAIERSS